MKQYRNTPRHGRIVLTHVACAVALTATPVYAAGDALTLDLPIDCTIGRNCFVQNYVDVDPSPAVRDYRCGAQSYDGHKGVDIRLLHDMAMERGVAVLAAAAGQVKALRDNMPDRRAAADDPAISGRECGNGVVIDHANGWQTQYCHLKRGSIRVRSGEQVTTGQPIGAVGLSGSTQFPHVHLSVRRGEKVIDPFTYTHTAQNTPRPSCAPSSSAAPIPLPGQNLWSAAAARALAYRPVSVIRVGFSGGPVTAGQIDQNAVPPLAPASDALVFYIRLLHLQKGDQQQLRILSPAGRTLLETTGEPPDRAKAQAHYFWGVRRKTRRWPAGVYRVVYRLTRQGKTVLSLQRYFTMPR